MSNNFGVNEIQAYLRGANLPEELIGELAAQYQEACDEANRRLEEVIRLLTAGYRDEALTLADEAPPLSEMLAKLDFAGREDWVVALSAIGYEQPSEIHLDQVTQLEEAYEERRRLEPLMKKHRLLALSRAPLAMRLAVLRKLAQADPTNLLWVDDVEKFETARLEEIRQEASLATRRKDMATLARLEEELSNTWRVKVPQSLLDKLATSSDSLSRKNAADELQEVAAQLNDCLSAFDTTRGARLRQRWNELNAVAELGPGDPTFDLANEALLWLAEADQERERNREYEEALEAFEQKISRELELPIVEKFWFQLRRYDREIPRELEQRFLQYRQRVLAAQTRQGRLKIAVAIASIAALGAIVAGFIWYSARQRQVAEARQQAADLAAERNVEAAEAWREKQPLWVQDDGEVVAKLADLRAVAKEIEGLTEKISANLEQVNGILEAGGPLERDLDGVIQSSLELAATLAEKRGKEGTEKTEIESLRARIDAEREKRLKDRTAEFSRRLSVASNRLKAIEETPLSEDQSQGLAELETELKELAAARADSKDGRPAIQPNVLALIPPLEQRIKQRRKSIDDYKASLERLGEITRQVGEAEPFSRELLSFANQFPASEWSGDFRAAAAEAPLWKGFDEWRRLAANPLWETLATADSSGLSSILAKLAELDSKQPLQGQEQNVARLRELLTLMVNSGQTTTEQLRSTIDERFNQVDYLEQQVIVEVSGVWKYLDGKIRDRGAFLLFDPYLDLLRDRASIERSKEARKEALLEWGLAGQARIADAMMLAAQKGYQSSPEELAVQLLRVVLAEYAPLAIGQQEGNLTGPTTSPDPIVQLLMTRQVLDECSGVSPLVADFVSEARNLAADFDLLKDADWMMWKSEATSRNRIKAAGILKELRELLAGFSDKVQKWKQRLESSANWEGLGDFEWCGWIRKVGNQYELASPQSDLPNGLEMYQVKPGPGGKGMVLQKVGIYRSGSLEEIPGGVQLKSGVPVIGMLKRGAGN